MSVSSARDHSGEWCRAALNVEVNRVITGSSEWALLVRVSGQGVPAGDTQPLAAAAVPIRPPGAGPWSGDPVVGGTWRGLPARVGRSNSVAGPGELAKGLLPVWGSHEDAVRVPKLCSLVPSASGARLPTSYTADWRSRVPRPAGPSNFRVLN